MAKSKVIHSLADCTTANERSSLVQGENKDSVLSVEAKSRRDWLERGFLFRHRKTKTTATLAVFRFQWLSLVTVGCAFATTRRRFVTAMITMNGSNGHPSQPQHHQKNGYSSSPTHQPMYNGVNPQYPGLRQIFAAPPIYCVDNFLTPGECNSLIQAGEREAGFTPAPVVGKGVGEISASRTSSTCYLAREDVPELMHKVSALLGKPIVHCELPQVGRYFESQQYVQHFDAFNLHEEDGRRFAQNGGQRTVTVLVYLNDVAQGGATAFPNLRHPSTNQCLQIQPHQGMALIFFPATLDGTLDKQVLHAALPAVDVKYVSQIWVRQGAYFGQASKRIPNVMGSTVSELATAEFLAKVCSLSDVNFGNNHNDGVLPMSP